MATLIFYKNIIPLDTGIHRQLKLKMQAKGYAYASVTNSVPLTTAEFGLACHDYPIVFVNDEQGVGLPLALLGLRDSQNLFVDAQGSWDARYIPAFVRRYPFVLQNSEGSPELRVLIDSEAEGFGDDSGERLFNDDGSNTELMTNTIDLLGQFNQAADYTAGFMRRVRELDLLSERTIQAVTATGENIQMGGVSVIDEARLNALGDADLLSLARSGYLAAIHAHLISLQSLEQIILRYSRNLA